MTWVDAILEFIPTAVLWIGHVDGGEPLSVVAVRGPVTLSAELNAREQLAAKAEKVRLLLLLAVRRDQPMAVSDTWQQISDPTTLGGVSFSQSVVMPTADALVDEDLDEISRWSDLIENRYDSSLDLAVRRTLSSIASRPEPGDALVDAVIALESLFGTGSGEIAFRVSAAVAWLLESDPVRRQARHGEVNKLYGLRSDVVHGKHVNQTKLYSSRLAASQLATDCLRKLLSDRPELIGAGNTRGKNLILQAA